MLSCKSYAGTNGAHLARFNFIKSLNDKSATILVVGAGFIGVEWVTELQHFFPRLKLTIIDFLPQPLGPLPANAAKYCEPRQHSLSPSVLCACVCLLSLSFFPLLPSLLLLFGCSRAL